MSSRSQRNRALALVRGATREGVEIAFKRLLPYLKKKRWLGLKNRYWYNCIEGINADANAKCLNDKHLQEYIAASTLLHCYDGWSFVGRAFDCIYRGDRGTACHLGYYAELRAAMSLLGVGSVGVFDDKHFIAQPSGKCEVISGGTHFIAWEAMKAWAENSDFIDILLDSLMPSAGIPLREWVDAFDASVVTMTVIGRKWLEGWGLDIQRFSDDKIARNKSSYRPRSMRVRLNLRAKDSVGFLCDSWGVLEPSPDARFERLDRYLMRIALEEANKAVVGQSRFIKKQYEQKVERMLGKLFENAEVIAGWKEFLTRRRDGDDPTVLACASRTDSEEKLSHHLQVVSRAILLLRLATGANSLLLKKVRIEKADLDFWWRTVGENTGLWDKDNVPDEFMDLWGEVEAAFECVAGKTDLVQHDSFSYRTWRESMADSISILGGCERIAFWGIGL